MFPSLRKSLFVLTVFWGILNPQSAFCRSLKDIGISQLNYVLKSQHQDKGPIYQVGEWSTQIHSTLIPIIVGVGKPIGSDEEPTPFTTASIVNQLAQIYLDHPELQEEENYLQIPQAIEKATQTFEAYREGELYNFYPAKVINGIRVHQPSDMTLMKVWHGFTNIPQDADTSSVVLTAKYYNELIKGSPFVLSPKVSQSYIKYRDYNRKSHYYNRGENRQNTGAFLTWQFDENDPAMPGNYFAKPEKGPRIPFKVNDVDCVVNLNILRLLALSGPIQVAGEPEACQMIEDMIRKKEHSTCGIYYPNSMNLSYAVSYLAKTGSSCLKKETYSEVVRYLLSEQNADGSWLNSRDIWKDKIQSTVFALNALLELGDMNENSVHAAVTAGTAFLIRNMKKAKNGELYYKGEVFFTATALARNLVVWKSDSYTTVLAAAVILKMYQLFPDRDQVFYERIPYVPETLMQNSGG